MLVCRFETKTKSSGIIAFSRKQFVTSTRSVQCGTEMLSNGQWRQPHGRTCVLAVRERVLGLWPVALWRATRV